MVRVAVSVLYCHVTFVPQLPETVAALAVNSNTPSGQIDIIKMIDNRTDKSFFILFPPIVLRIATLTLAMTKNKKVRSRSHAPKNAQLRLLRHNLPTYKDAKDGAAFLPKGKMHLRIMGILDCVARSVYHKRREKAI